jgi:hypothetical protein
MFSSDNPSLAAGKMRQIYLSQAAFGITLQDHWQLFLCMPFWGQNHRFRVFEEGYSTNFQKLVSNVKGTSHNFDFSITQQKIVKTIRAYTYLIFYTFKKYSSRYPIPLNVQYF